MHQIFGIKLHNLVLCLALLLGLGLPARAGEAPWAPGARLVTQEYVEEKLVFYFGSAGNVQYGFAKFNEDCLSSTSDANNRQIMHVATHVNSVMELGWGDWSSPKGRQNIADCMVKRFIEAKALGIKVAIASVDFILWDNSTAPDFRYRGDDVVMPELRSFFRQLEANGVLDMVKRGFCYIMDEPALYGITGEEMRQAIGAVQKVAFEFKSLGYCKTYVIYHYGGYPGIELVDMVGHDHYDIGAGILSSYEFELFRAMLRPLGSANPQWVSVVPGGAFGQDPVPFFGKLQQDPQVKVVNAFIFFDGWADGRLGIHGNGLAERYCTEGKKFLNPKVEHPDCTSPPPDVHLTVNGEKQVTVEIGEEFCYRWSASNVAEGATFTSYWWSSNPACSYGLNGSPVWDARGAYGGYCYRALPEQAGCTYTITYAGCGTGARCSASAIGVTVKSPNEK